MSCISTFQQVAIPLPNCSVSWTLPSPQSLCAPSLSATQGVCFTTSIPFRTQTRIHDSKARANMNKSSYTKTPCATSTVHILGRQNLLEAFLLQTDTIQAFEKTSSSGNARKPSDGSDSIRRGSGQPFPRAGSLCLVLGLAWHSQLFGSRAGGGPFGSSTSNYLTDSVLPSNGRSALLSNLLFSISSAAPPTGGLIDKDSPPYCSQHSTCVYPLQGYRQIR